MVPGCSPILGRNYLDVEWFVPQTGLTAVLEGLSFRFYLSQVLRKERYTRTYC